MGLAIAQTMPCGAGDLSRRLPKRQGATWIASLGLAALIFLWGEGFLLDAFKLHPDLMVLRLAACVLVVAWTVRWLLTRRLPSADARRYLAMIAAMLAVVVLVTFLAARQSSSASLVNLLRANVFFAGFLVFVPMCHCFGLSADGVKRVNATILIMAVLAVGLQVGAVLWPSLAELFDSRAFLVSRFGRDRMTLGAATYPCFLYTAIYCGTSLLTVRLQPLQALSRAAVFVLIMGYMLLVFMSRRNALMLVVVLGVYALARIWSLRCAIVLCAVTVAVALIEVGTEIEVVGSVIDSWRTIVEESTANDGNIGIRDEGFRYYWAYFENSRYLGLGSVFSDNGLFENGLANGYNPVDHGIFGVVYLYGPLGLLAVAVGTWRVLADLIASKGPLPPELMAIRRSLLLYLLLLITTAFQLFLLDIQSFWWGVYCYMVLASSAGAVAQSNSAAALEHRHGRRLCRLPHCGLKEAG